jgi:hypothetical protein
MLSVNVAEVFHVPEDWLRIAHQLRLGVITDAHPCHLVSSNEPSIQKLLASITKILLIPVTA